MEDRKYTVRFLPLFEEDLNDIVDYITCRLKNPEAASHLVDEIEAAILIEAIVRKALSHILLKKSGDICTIEFM